MRSPIQHPLPLHVPRYVLTFADVEYDAGAFRRVADAEAKAVVTGALADAATRPRRLRLWAQATGESVTAPDRDRGFAQRWLLDALLSRPARLVLLSRLPIAVGGDLEIIEPAKALLPPTSLSWLEFEVLYADAPDAPEPAVGIPYSARIDPDKPKDSRLDRNGYAYISGLEPGSYQVVFPETAVEPKEQLSWLDIELVDAGGLPVAGAQYEVKVEGGSPRSSTLDASGRVHLAGLPPGEHQVIFPSLDEPEAAGRV